MERRSTSKAACSPWEPQKCKSGIMVSLFTAGSSARGGYGNGEIFHHPLAPMKVSDAFYLQYNYDSLYKACGFQTTSPPTSSIGNFVYVPLRFIRFSAEGRYGKDIDIVTGKDIDLSGDKKVSMNYKVPTRPATESESEALIEDENEAKGFQPSANALDSLKKIRKMFGRNSAIPFRDSKGTLYWARVQGIKNQGHYIHMWSQIFKAAPKLGGEGSSGRFARYDDRKMENPLVVVIKPAAKIRFRDSVYGSGRDLIRDLIDVINEIYERPKSGTDPRKGQVEFKKEMAPDPDFESKYCQLSENPFGLFQTYIHKDDVTAYMIELSKGLKEQKTEKDPPSTPIRNVPGVDFSKDMLRYLRDLDGVSSDDINRTDQHDNGGITTIAPARTEAIRQKSEISGEAVTTSEQEFQRSQGIAENPGRNSAPVSPEEATSTSSSKERKTRVERHWNHSPELNSWRELHSTSSYSFQNISLSSRKIEKAVGTREGKPSQQQVMGFSAAEFAERVLKWSPPDNSKNASHERQMPNGLYIAEWLHLCAYSWGGLLEEVADPDADYSESHNSSQTVDNMVFGTSEANSCMTRYESSWQTLFKDEAAMAKARTGRSDINITGHLQLQRNGKRCEYGYDKIDHQNRFSFEKENMDDMASFKIGSPLVTAARHAKLLAYTISYEPSILPRQQACTAGRGSSRTSLILDRSDTVRQQVEFYPFSRRFFHRVEDLLDSGLYLAMYILAARKHCGEMATDMIEKKLKDVTIDQRIKDVLKIEVQKDSMNQIKALQETQADIFAGVAAKLSGHSKSTQIFEYRSVDQEPSTSSGGPHRHTTGRAADSRNRDYAISTDGYAKMEVASTETTQGRSNTGTKRRGSSRKGDRKRTGSNGGQNLMHGSSEAQLSDVDDT